MGFFCISQHPDCAQSIIQMTPWRDDFEFLTNANQSNLISLPIYFLSAILFMGWRKVNPLICVKLIEKKVLDLLPIEMIFFMNILWQIAIASGYMGIWIPCHFAYRTFWLLSFRLRRLANRTFRLLSFCLRRFAYNDDDNDDDNDFIAYLT